MEGNITIWWKNICQHGFIFPQMGLNIKTTCLKPPLDKAPVVKNKSNLRTQRLHHGILSLGFTWGSPVAKTGIGGIHSDFKLPSFRSNYNLSLPTFSRPPSRTWPESLPSDHHPTKPGDEVGLIPKNICMKSGLEADCHNAHCGRWYNPKSTNLFFS